MIVKKAGKVVLGAQLTSEEQKAIDIVIKKQIAEMNRKNADEIDAMILWELGEQLDMSVEDMRKFYDRFAVGLRELNARYEMDADDIPWLCTYKLKDRYGIDISEWAEENLRKQK